MAKAAETVPDDRVGASVHGDLLVAVGNGRLLSHALVTTEVVIGRDATCDFTIDDASLSRRHAVVRVRGGTSTVQDLGSTNGTRVAGRTLRGGEPVALDDSGFQIGKYAILQLARGGGKAGRSVATADQLRVEDPTRDGVSQIVRDFAASDASLLITGETGVGKEVLAETVHALSRRSGAFVKINCAALADTLLESELFGYARGAFTGATTPKRGLIEAADGGTLLLDEIGELPPATQAKLLRVIEQREVLRLGSTEPTAIDVRFLAATHRDLAAEVARGAFRADLYYRLDGVTLTIPPLRARPGAIVPLAARFASEARPGAGARFPADVVAALAGHAWPGNVRELKAVIARAVVLAGAGDIAVRHLTFTAAPRSPVAPTSDERDQIVRALADCAGNQSRAAKLLGISRTTLVTKLRIYNIPRPTR